VPATSVGQQLAESPSQMTQLRAPIHYKSKTYLPFAQNVDISKFPRTIADLQVSSSGVTSLKVAS
jgi:hypothetical protein